MVKGIVEQATQAWMKQAGDVLLLRQTLREYRGAVAQLVPPPTPSIAVELPPGVTGSCGSGAARDFDGVEQPRYGACSFVLTASRTSAFISVAGQESSAVTALQDVATRFLQGAA